MQVPKKTSDNRDCQTNQSHELATGLDNNQPSSSITLDQTTTTVKCADKMTETIDSEDYFKRRLLQENEELRKQIRCLRFDFENCCLDPKMFEFYIGLHPDQFDMMWNFFGPDTKQLVIWQGQQRTGKDKRSYLKTTKTISPKNQLFITLVRLRCGLLMKDIAYRFNISESYVSKIILTWITFMYEKFKSLDIFPERETDRSKIPKIFRKFKNIRVIIDGFELRTQKPKDYREQGNVYSNYKSCPTHKFLIGIHVSGAVSFLSDAFEGSISDRELFERSGIMAYLIKQDLIMADRGFNIGDICNSIGCNVIVPPFLSGRDKFTKHEVDITRSIASARIHVERTIGRIKEFRILQKVVPKSLVPIISQMTFVIGMLVNFQEPLVK